MHASSVGAEGSAPHEPQILVVAGEASGEQHLARLIASIRRRRPGLRFWGIGGEQMRQQGVELLYTAAEMSVVGFVEVARRYRFFRNALEQVAERAAAERPLFAILTDYPGFNLRLAARLHEAGIPVVYYIAPQVWAWKEGRVEQLRRVVRDLIVVFPFEVEYFRGHGIQAHFFGHPLVEQIEEAREKRVEDGGSSPATVAYLPGSRPEEIRRHMPVLLEVMKGLGEGYRHVVAKAGTISRSTFDAYDDGGRFELVDDTWSALQHARAAVVKSGTSTVETALLGVPFCVMYRTSPISYLIARSAVKVPYIAMVNILAGRAIVREFVQADVRAEALTGEMKRILDDEGYRKTLLEGLAEVRAMLGERGAAERTAEYLVDRYL